MTYEFYKVAHIAGIIMLFMGLAGIVALRMAGTELALIPRRLFFLTHGAGLLIVIIAGFGMAARLGIMQSLPMWLIAKLVIWLVLGGSIALAKRRGYVGGPLLILFIVLGATAAWLAITKPF